MGHVLTISPHSGTVSILVSALFQKTFSDNLPLPVWQKAFTNKYIEMNYMEMLQNFNTKLSTFLLAEIYTWYVHDRNASTALFPYVSLGMLEQL